MGAQMDLTTRQVVKADAAEFEDPTAEELEGVEAITDDACELEAPELSIEELEQFFSDLN
jgi:hypothetical protein